MEYPPSTKPVRRQILAAAMCAGLLLPAPVALPVAAALTDAAVSDVVSAETVSAEVTDATLDICDFLDMLRDNEGGTIALTGDVVLRGYDDIIRVDRPTTVLMGDYSMIIPDDGGISIAGPIRFEGSGTEKPLFIVEGYLYTEWVEIVATGDGATALYADRNFDLACASIRATGQGATGIHATGFVILRMCEVLADGDAILSDTGYIEINGCNVSPVPEGARAIQREAVPGLRIQENGICVPAGASLEDELAYFCIEYYLLDTERVEGADGYYPCVTFGNLPEDTSVPGEYQILCIPPPLPDWIPVPGIGPFEVTLHIVAEDQPHIENAMIMWGAVGLQFFPNHLLDLDDEALILWYSTDGGMTWRDILTFPDVYLSSFGSRIVSLPMDEVYLFRLEVTEGSMKGFSNILEFPYYTSDPDSEGGGDRSGVDRFPLWAPPRDKEDKGNDELSGDGRETGESEEFVEGEYPDYGDEPGDNEDSVNGDNSVDDEDSVNSEESGVVEEAENSRDDGDGTSGKLPDAGSPPAGQTTDSAVIYLAGKTTDGAANDAVGNLANDAAGKPADGAASEPADDATCLPAAESADMPAEERLSLLRDSSVVSITGGDIPLSTRPMLAEDPAPAAAVLSEPAGSAGPSNDGAESLTPKQFSLQADTTIAPQALPAPLDSPVASAVISRQPDRSERMFSIGVITLIAGIALILLLGAAVGINVFKRR